MSIFPVGAKVGGDVGGFVSAMASGARGLTAFAGAAGLAAGGLGALAGAAAMGAAIKSAREYQAELIKLNTLVGIQIDQVMAWDSALKDLAVETGRAPADLARAMFAITSGGARGTEAMELLEQAAKASAIGLGDMTSIGRTATAMLQAFGDEGLTAQKAIDIMVATTREGNLEAEGLATAFSRVLGPAKALGSSVEDIGAFMATFTRLGGSTEEAATGLLNVFNLLIKPPKDAREAMEEMGISIEDLRATIQERGLMAALIDMRDAIGDNVDALGRIIPNTRALIGFLNTAGLQAEQFAVSQDAINDSLGVTNEGFETWGDTADATFTRFTASLKVAGIAVGEALLPPLQLLLELITPLVAALGSFVDVLDDIGRFLIGDLGDDLERFIFWMMGVKEAAEPTAEALASMKAEFGAMTDDEQLARQKELREEISRMNRIIENGGRGAKAAIRRRAEDVEQLLVLGPLILARGEAEDVATEAIERATVMTEEQIKAEEQRLESLDQILSALETQVLRLEEGEFAVIAHELAMLDASDATIEYAQEQFDLVKALEEAASAEKEAERAATRTARTRKREADRLQKAREKAVRDVRDAAIRLAEDTRLAEMQDDIREITRISTQMADSIGEAAIRIAGDLDQIGAAFRDLVTDILTQIQRLIIQKTIVEPLVGALVGALTGGFSNQSIAAGVEGFGKQLAGAGISNLPPGTNAFGLSMAPAVIVQQSITFAPSFIDSRDGARWLRENQGEIMTIVSEGAQRSTAFANSLRGQIG